MILRPATPADLPAIAHLFRDLAVDGPPPGPEALAAPFRLTVAEEAGAVVAYTLVDETRVAPPAPEAGARFLRQIVVAATARRTGLGRLLVDDAARGEGLALNADSTGEARAFYTHLGFTAVGAAESVRVPYRAVDAMPVYACTAGPLASAEHPRFAAALSVELHRLTPRGEAQVLGAWEDDGTPLAVARFDPAFPGCYPIRVARPAVLTELLRAIERVHDGPALTLVLEDDPASAGLLRAFGGETRLSLVRLFRPGAPHADLSGTDAELRLR